MGSPKADLAWHGSTVLRRVVGIVARAVQGPVIVVAAPGQRFVDLPADVSVLSDPHEGRGPLQGLAAGLSAVAAVPADIAFVCSTDVPLLHPVVVRRILRGLHGAVDVALPQIDGHRHPLTAAYRTRLAGPVARWLAEGERRVNTIVDCLCLDVLGRDDLLDDAAVRDADPDLRSFWNLNRPADYRAALALALPRVTVRHAVGGARVVGAATVEMAVAAAGYAFGEHSKVILDGDAVTDGSVPLVSGDVLTIRRRSG